MSSQKRGGAREVARTLASGIPIAYPLVAAYEAGRLLNQLDWHLQQAWLLHWLLQRGAHGHAAEVGDTLTQLTSTLRQAVPLTVRERVHESCLACRDEWSSHFGSPGHFDEIDNQSRFLRDELSQDGEIAPDAVRAEVWGDALRAVKPIAQKLYEAAEAVLDERSRLALGLGRCIDCGLRPRDVFRHMSREPAECCASPSPGVSPWSLPAEAASTSSPFLLRGVAPGEIPPEQGWLEEVQARWAELGLVFKMPRPGGEAPNGAQAGTALELTDTTQVDELDRAARKGLAELSEPWPHQQARIHRQPSSGRGESKPRWDDERGELIHEEKVIRRVSRGKAVNVVRVLQAFEAVGWPSRVPSPFGNDWEKMHETIRSLNKGLQVIRFRADGTGKGVLWDLEAVNR
jgi:hypothetical protein